MPRAADPTIRVRLIEAAARILAEEGSAALTLRRVAAEVGASTMVVYTHFGGMEDLRHAVRVQGFERLAAHMAAVAPSTKDPLARLMELGAAYFQNALDNPHLYRAMFVDHPLNGSGEDVGYDTFLTLVDAVRDCIDAGRFHRADPVHLANQIWVGIHGVVTLHLAGLLGLDEAIRACTDYAVNLFIGFGADARKLRAAVKAYASR